MERILGIIRKMHKKLVKNGKRLVWTPEQLALLGSDSDAVLAKKLGCSKGSIYTTRTRLKIPPAYITAIDYPRQVGARISHLDPWTPEQDALLGKASDSEVAKKLNRTLYRVQGRRKKLGIPSCRRRDWLGSLRPEVSHEIQKLFARHRDQALCGILKWDLQRVRETRHRLAVVAGGKNRPWTEEETQMLGTAPDRVIARKLKRSLQSVKVRRQRRGLRLYKRWLPADDAILGTRPDGELAKLLSRGTSDVYWRRHHLGKAPYGGAAPALWTPEHDAELGKESDELLARKFGRSIKAVVKRRRELKIPPPPGERRRNFVWTPELDALIGTAPDAEIARAIGVTQASVLKRRRHLKIRFDGLKRRRWSKEEEGWLGKLSDQEISDRTGIPLDRVVTKRERMTREGRGNFSNTPPPTSE